MLVLTVDNKDKLDDIIITEDTILNIRLNDCKQVINIDVMDNMCLEVTEIDNGTTNMINYNLRSNSQVVVNKLGRNVSDKTIVHLCGENASFKCYTSLLNYSNNIFDLIVYHDSMKTYSEVVTHGINFTNRELKLIIDAKVDKGVNGCQCLQDSKIIDMGNGNNYISPNLLIDNDDIAASHSAYIGKFKKDILFYMMSRGIAEEDCNYLLARGFLIGKMQLDEQKKEEYEIFINNNFSR